MARLGDLTNIKTGKLDANASSENGQYPFFTCAVEPLKIDSYSYDCECVLVAGNGDLNVKYYNGKFDAYQRTYIIESKDKETLYVPYLYYFLDMYVEELRKQAIGGVIKYIKLGNLTEAQIPLPTISKQKTIVEKLNKSYHLISLRKKQLQKLDDLVKARFVEMFGDPVINPMEWKQANMKSVCKKITDGEHGSVPREATGHPFLNAKHIKQNGAIDWQTVTYTSDEVHRKIYSRCNPEADDILMTTTGTIGNVAIVPVVEEFSMDRGITLLKLNRTIVSPHFVAWLLRFDAMQIIMTANVHASAIGHLFLNKVEQLPVIVPPMQLQNQFAAFISHVDKSKFSIQQGLEKLETLKKSLMQQYFG